MLYAMITYVLQITSTSKKPVTTHSLSQDDLLPVNLLRWEDDIIMDGSEINPQVVSSQKFSNDFDASF